MQHKNREATITLARVHISVHSEMPPFVLILLFHACLINRLTEWKFGHFVCAFCFATPFNT